MPRISAALDPGGTPAALSPRARVKHDHFGAPFLSRAPRAVVSVSACAGSGPLSAIRTGRCYLMSQTPPKTGRFRPARDRWTRLTIAAVAAMVAGSLIARRAAHSAGQAGNATADTETTGPTERVSSAGQTLAQTITGRLRRTGTAAAGRLGAAGHAAWRELQHPGHSMRRVPDPAAPSAGPAEHAGPEGTAGAQPVAAVADQTGKP
jgi:hypothetical protein